MSRRSLAIIILLAIVAGPMTASAAPSGSLSVEGGEIHDWGKVRPEELTHVFVIRNSGDGDLRIHDVRGSCGCMIVRVGKTLLHPGDSAHVDLLLTVRSMTGHTEKAFTITSDDPVRPTVVCRVRAFVVRPITLRPANYIAVQGGQVGVETDATVTIINTGDSTCTFDPPELVSGDVAVRFDLNGGRTLRPGEELPLTAHITPLREGRGVGIIAMKTSISGIPRIEISLYLDIVRATSAPPPLPSK